VLGLYLHIPFCASICHYCNFTRGLLDEAVKARYVDALEREIHQSSDGSPADTIFFGGGTPSLLSPPEVRRLVSACRNGFDVMPDAEVTLEANPETVTSDRLAAYREAGVTRLSFGVQSLDERELARLGRETPSRRRVRPGSTMSASI
jgi:oxygen-independent coproporphyrinogen-3 oxidase